MTLNIRDAVPDDMEEVRAMMTALAWHHGETVTTSAAAMRRQIFDQRLGRIIVAAEEEGLVGYALLLARPNLVTGRMGHDINHLFVVEWRRHGGIGKALIAACRAVAEAEGAEFLTIGTKLENQGAQKAYRGMGLEEMSPSGPRFKVSLAA